MPPALSRVEEASVLLIEASDMLRTDPYSAAARKKLIEGSRGNMMNYRPQNFTCVDEQFNYELVFYFSLFILRLISVDWR